MSFKIYYTHLLQHKQSFSKRLELSLLKINKNNFTANKDYIQASIDTFNSEIEWESMWDLDDAEIRLLNKETLFILLDVDTPIGHVWYDQYYLYNAFVSKERCDGDSPWFIQETMWDMKDSHNLSYIKLYVDSWNNRAIKFWEKLGFIKQI